MASKSTGQLLTKEQRNLITGVVATKEKSKSDSKKEQDNKKYKEKTHRSQRLSKIDKRVISKLPTIISDFFDDIVLIEKYLEFKGDSEKVNEINSQINQSIYIAELTLRANLIPHVIIESKNKAVQKEIDKMHRKFNGLVEKFSQSSLSGSFKLLEEIYFATFKNFNPRVKHKIGDVPERVIKNEWKSHKKFLNVLSKYELIKIQDSRNKVWLSSMGEAVYRGVKKKKVTN